MYALLPVQTKRELQLNILIRLIWEILKVLVKSDVYSCCLFTHKTTFKYSLDIANYFQFHCIWLLLCPSVTLSNHLFWIHTMYTFLHKKKKTLYIEHFFKFVRCTRLINMFGSKSRTLCIEHFFKFVKCTPLINMFGSKSRTLTQQNSRLLVHQIVLHILCKLVMQWDLINAQN